MAQLINEDGQICLFNDEGQLVASGDGAEGFVADLFYADEHEWAERILGNQDVLIDIAPHETKEIHEWIKVYQMNESPTEEALKENFRNEY